MAFKMKNAALKKQVEVAACPRTAMKMAAKDAAMKKMHSPAAKMETPAKAMDAPTKAMTKSPAEFNAKLRKAKAEGKLPKEFASVVKKKDDEMDRLMEIRRKTDPNDRDAMREIDMKIRAHARKMGLRNVPDEETGGPREPKKKAPLEMESPNKKKNPNVQGSKAKAYQRKLDKAAKKDKKASKKYNEAFDTGGHNTGGKGFDRKLKAADRKGRKADKKRAKADKKIAKISGYYKFLSKDEKKAMR